MAEQKDKEIVVEPIWISLQQAAAKTRSKRFIRFMHEKRLEFLARKMCELLIRRKRER